MVEGSCIQHPQIGIFAVGGGGGGDKSCCGGGSGYFRYKTIDITEDNTRVLVKTVGSGGYYNGGTGSHTEVYVDYEGPTQTVVYGDPGGL